MKNEHTPKGIFWIMSLILLFLISGLQSSEIEKVKQDQNKQSEPSGVILQNMRDVQVKQSIMTRGHQEQARLRKFNENSEKNARMEKLKRLQEIIRGSEMAPAKRLPAPNLRKRPALQLPKTSSVIYGSGRMSVNSSKSNRFESDRMYQPDGTPHFNKTPQNLNFLVNGELSDTVVVGDAPVFTFDFPSESDQAVFTPIWDANENGIIDSGDIWIEETELVDNDENDGDPTIGSYSFTLGEDSEGFNRISASFIYELFCGGISEYTHLLWEPLESEFSVSGVATLEDGSVISGIVVFAYQEDLDEVWIDITDSEGNYFIAVPDSMNYFVASFDYLEVTDGLVPDPPEYEVYIDGALSGFDFVYGMPNSLIYGNVVDNNGAPLVYVGLEAEPEDGPTFYGETNENGYYQIPVPEGDYKVGFNEEDLFPTYMAPRRQYVYVPDMDSAQVDFTVYPGDAFISGTVYYNDLPAPGYRVSAFHNVPPEEEHFGYTFTETDDNGNFTLYVHYGDGPSPAEYFVQAIDLPETVVQVEWYDHIPAGTEGLQIHLLDVTGGLTGYFINSVTGDTIYERAGMSIDGIDNDYHFGVGPDWDTGQYTIYLPNGTYELLAGGEEFYPAPPDTVTIADAMIQHDVYLDPIEYTGAVYGTITDCDNNQPIGGAQVFVWGDYWGYSTFTDSTGYYWIDTPQGHFYVHAEMQGYQGNGMEVDVQDNEVEASFCLAPFVVNGSFSGTVLDSTTGLPIVDAGVHVYNMDWDFFQFTDESGHFYFDLPNGYYDVEIGLEGYQVIFDAVEIMNNDVVRDYYLLPIPMESIIAGNVFDSETGSAIANAEVYLFNWDWSFAFQQFTDENGDFAFYVPNNCYMLDVYAEDYVPVHFDSICVQDDSVWIDVPMEMPDGNVHGYVYDSETNSPIPRAWIGIQALNTDEWIYDEADDFGYYEVPLLNGTYQIYAGAFEYMTSFPDTFTVDNNEVELNIYLEYRPPFIPPHILGVEDQPNDQGRWVRITFDGGATDMGPYKGWSIWRLRTNSIPVIPDTGFYDFDLDFIAYIPFHGDQVYSFVAPTLVDSNAYTTESGEYWSTFIVSAHLPYDMYQWIDSPPASGYSIDNIAPGVPGGLLATGSDNGIQLTWDNVPDDDFGYFAVYRSDVSGNYSDTPIAMTVEPGFTDSEVTAGVTYYYIVTAVDANGNEGEPSAEANFTITGLDEAQPVPDNFALHPNFPNPFNPETQIRYDLPEDSHVLLRIYDLNGRLIKTLVNENKAAGFHSVIWDGTDERGIQASTGMYLYQIQAGTKFTATGKMVFMK